MIYHTHHAPSSCRLAEEGLSDQRYSTAAYQFTAGKGSLDVEGVVAAIREAKEAREAVEARQSRILELLTAEGLQSYQRSTAAAQLYISSGQGSEEAVVEAARQKRAVDQRREAVAARLAAEGVPAHYTSRYHMPSAADYIDRGEGSEDAVVAAAVAQHQLEEARVQRRNALGALLAAEQLSAAYLYRVAAVADYIASNAGSEEGAMEAARAQHQLEQVRAERRNAGYNTDPDAGYES